MQTLDFLKSLIPAPLYTPLQRLYHRALCQVERRSDHENAMTPPPHMNFVGDGDFVEIGQGLVVVEAMKMQNEMKSPIAGTVTKVQAEEGATVTANQVLVVVETDAG